MGSWVCCVCVLHVEVACVIRGGSLEKCMVYDVLSMLMLSAFLSYWPILHGNGEWLFLAGRYEF